MTNDFEECPWCGAPKSIDHKHCTNLICEYVEGETIELKKKMTSCYSDRRNPIEIEYEVIGLPCYVEIIFDKEEGNRNGTIKSVIIDGEVIRKMGREKSFEIMRTIMGFNREIINTNIDNRIKYAPKANRRM